MRQSAGFRPLSQILFGTALMLESHQYSYSVCPHLPAPGWNWPPGGKFWWTADTQEVPHEGSYCDVSIASGSIVQGIRLLHKKCTDLP